VFHVQRPRARGQCRRADIGRKAPFCNGIGLERRPESATARRVGGGVFRLEELAREPARGLGDVGAADHPRELLDLAPPVELVDARLGALADALLSDREVGVGEASDLGLVGDTDDLVCAAEVPEPPADRLRHAPADPDVDLVEDERARDLGRRGDGLEREHQPRDLAARRDAHERPGLLARVCRDEELDPVEPGGAVALLAVDRVDRDVDQCG
jgi:hypothetical protein